MNYQVDYRSGHDNLVSDFFQPSLREAGQYWRAVGYFSSSALEAFGSPLGQFIKGGGQIRLVTSVELSEADLRAIENGSPKKEICADRLKQIIESEFADGAGDGTVRLARMLELGRLEIRIAVPTTGTGIYHEKIGLFIDADDFVAFTGSSNESRSAFEKNRECIDVYPSWSSSQRAERKKAHFKSLWNRTDDGVEVFTFPEAARQKLLRVCRKSKTGPRPPLQIENKWRHQDEAVKVFLTTERGVLNMATGTGKTRTALKILKALFRRGDIETAIICTDGNDLLDQWFRELSRLRKEFGRNIRLFRQYQRHRDKQTFVLRPKNAFLLISRKPLASVLRDLSSQQLRRTLLTHDEVHGLGSPGNRARLNGLSDDVRFRLGLSATPEREYDEDGNEFIKKHIGPVLMTFRLRQAIQRGILAPFRYHPIKFTITEADRKRLQAIYRRKKAREKAGDPMKDTELWIQLARVYKTSRAKLSVFSDFIETNQELLIRSIIFTETMEYGNDVLDIVHQHRPDFHTYFSGDHEEVLRRFASADLECLLTCHRLSEGIDIKSLNSVILFSSARARLETIQRIGRCLRFDPNDPNKIANIIDFIRQDDADKPNADQLRCDWLTELSTIRPLDWRSTSG